MRVQIPPLLQTFKINIMEKREIEFRVWDKNENKMYKSGICVGYGVNGLYIIDGDDRYDDVMEVNWLFEKNITDNIKEEELVIMQYTGFKDKNGKEIYEGDIMRADWGTVYVVKYDRGAFILYNEFIENRLMCNWRNWSKIEVVGNIYENKELLTN